MEAERSARPLGNLAMIDRKVATFLVLVLLGACAQPPAEQRLRDTVAGMEKAIEARNVAEFLEGVAVDFSGNEGQYDRRQLHAALRGLTLRHRDIGVALGPLDVTMHGDDRAAVKVVAIVTGGSGGLLPDSGRSLRIDSGWRLDGGEWRCISASWSD